jgi:hypothetical protein
MQMPTNRSFSVTRKGVANTLTNLDAMLLPPSSRTISLLIMIDVPAVKSFEVYFNGPCDVREQDQLVSETDPTETYRVRIVEQYDTPHLAHTAAFVERVWGTN